MTKFLFQLRYAYRNITRNFFRSFSLLLTMIMVIFVVMIALSIRDGIQKGYEANNLYQYPNIDIIITYDTDSKNKIINSDKLKDYYRQYDFYAGFFELTTVVYHGDASLDVGLTAGTAEELGHLCECEFAHLQNDEVIITEGVSNTLGVTIGDSIMVYVAATPVSYRVVDIANNEAYFSGNGIFLQKNAYLKQFSKEILGQDLSEITQITICNRILIDVKDGIDIKAFCETLETVYPNSVIRATSDYSEYYPEIDMVVSTVYAAVIIVCLALVFVLGSIITLRVKNFKNEIGIIETLGGNKKYPFIVFGLEVGAFSIIATIINCFVITWLYENEFSVFVGRGKFGYQMPWYAILGSFVLIVVVSSLLILWRYGKYRKLETLDLTKNKRYEQSVSFKGAIIVSSICVALLLINNLILRNVLYYEYYGTFNFIIVIVFSVYIVSFALEIIGRMHKKASPFQMTFARNMQSNHLKHNSLRILVICLAALCAVGAADKTISVTFDQIRDTISMNYVLGNVRQYREEMVQDIESYEIVDDAFPAIYYSRAVSKTLNASFRYFYSCSAENVGKCMQFTMTNDIQSKFTDATKKYIILDNSMAYIHHLKIGDTISVEVGDDTRTYAILAFYDLGFQQLACTNDYYSDATAVNAIIIFANASTEEAKTTFKKGMTETYGSNLNFLISVDDNLDRLLGNYEVVINLTYVILSIIIVCFLVAIINNTVLNFQEIKTELAILQILGVSPPKLYKMVLREMLLSYLAIIGPLIILVATIYLNFGGLVLLFGYYKAMNFSMARTLLMLALGFGCFVISYIYYFIGIRRINVCQELKK